MAGVYNQSAAFPVQGMMGHGSLWKQLPMLIDALTMRIVTACIAAHSLQRTLSALIVPVWAG